jgi:type IV pilus assembly protein PilB
METFDPNSSHSRDTLVKAHPIESLLVGDSEWVTVSEAIRMLDSFHLEHQEELKSPHKKSRVANLRRGLKAKMIGRREIKRAIEHQETHGGHITEIFVKLGFVNEEELVQELTIHYGFPYLPLSSYQIDSSVARLIPLELAQKYFAIPIDRIGNNLMIAMANPLNAKAIKEIEQVSGCKVQTFVSTISDIKNAIRANLNLMEITS